MIKHTKSLGFSNVTMTNNFTKLNFKNVYLSCFMYVLSWPYTSGTFLKLESLLLFSSCVNRRRSSPFIASQNSGCKAKAAARIRLVPKPQEMWHGSLSLISKQPFGFGQSTELSPQVPENRIYSFRSEWCANILSLLPGSKRVGRLN